eukprot:CAMPEP_0182807730 /NCGR_PEP_ID=MMETSP0006_2-20121128/6281_1 /TAXON_ID=97485 /ORGANISM="Prymnesium parvum, Strain Texoma1" /LENGTH=156 /DNA_ID=CAMNT_0024933417 /DNA_START=91 /DNA_END=563 /DNA_ORIENTATION=+
MPNSRAFHNESLALSVRTSASHFSYGGTPQQQKITIRTSTAGELRGSLGLTLSPQGPVLSVALGALRTPGRTPREARGLLTLAKISSISTSRDILSGSPKPQEQDDNAGAMEFSADAAHEESDDGPSPMGLILYRRSRARWKSSAAREPSLIAIAA